MKASASVQVLLSAWQARRNQGSMRVTWLLLALLVLVPVVAWVLLPAPRAAQGALVTAGMLACMLLMGAWALLCFNVLQQNVPDLARELPRQVHVLRRTLMAVALFLVAMGAVFTWAASGRATPGLVICVAMLGSVTVMLRWPSALFVLAMGGMVLANAMRFDASQAVAAGWLKWPGLFDLMAVLALLAVLHAVVMSGGERHVRAHARLQKMALVQRGARFGGGWLWLEALVERFSNAWSRHLLGRQGTSVRARLALGLGSTAHAMGAVGRAAAFVGCGLLVLLAGWAWPNSSMATGARTGGLIGVAINAAMVVGQLCQSLQATRREQALLVLLPGIPRGPALNRWLAAYLARQFLLFSVTIFGGLFLLVKVFDLSSEAGGVIGPLACVAVMLPWLLLLLWRDWSRVRQMSGAVNLVPSLIALGFFLLAIVWTEALDRPWWALALCSTAVSAPVLVWRWRSLGRMPAPWPVGRLRDQAPEPAAAGR